MSRGFYLKMAGGNIKKNSSTYIPYILTCILTVAMFYIIRSLSLNPGLKTVWGAAQVASVMNMGSNIVAIFSVIFLFYTNSFLVKRRKKEFGVCNILGMEKRHLAKVLGWETLYVMLLSIGAGLVFGIVLDKCIFLLLLKIIDGEIPLGFQISTQALVNTVVLFGIIFLLIYFNAVRQIFVANPMEFLRGGNVGEKEPKSNLFVTFLGIVCLGTGYVIALTIKNPVASVALFFPAAILVIAGTYFLFTSGSIIFLKLLRKNKGYYYQTRHFISISSMLYRMKQNAVGLANICVLSAMVLVMISSTTSLLFGIDEMVQKHCPYDFWIYSEQGEQKDREVVEQIQKLQKEEGFLPTNEIQYSYLNFTGISQEDGFLIARGDNMEQMEALKQIDNIADLFFITLEDYNRIMGTDYQLHDGELLLYEGENAYDQPVMKLFDTEYTIKHVDNYPSDIITIANVGNNQLMVVPDREELDRLYELQKEVYTNASSTITMCYGFDTGKDDEENVAFYEKINSFIRVQGWEMTLEARANAKDDAIGLYGGLFFLGVFLGLLFVMATVLIIYYKQISEGYEDKERYEIMQKVGMGADEVKSSIHSQVLTVFFLPLIAAGIHMAVAFPLISKILECMYLDNIKLFAVCSVSSFLVFAVLYICIYLMTARMYYRIVKR